YHSRAGGLANPSAARPGLLVSVNPSGSIPAREGYRDDVLPCSHLSDEDAGSLMGSRAEEGPAEQPFVRPHEDGIQAPFLARVRHRSLPSQVATGLKACEDVVAVFVVAAFNIAGGLFQVLLIQL